MMNVLKLIKNRGKLIMAAAKKKPVLKVSLNPALPEDAFHGYATKGSAGLDLKCAVGKGQTLKSETTAIIRTGVSVAIPEGYVGILASRSGIGVNRGLSVAQGVGVIDSDYRGEVLVPLHNRNNHAEVVKFGERIAQLLIVPVIQPEVVFVEELDETERGDGGFGSTGE
jgi:dUTP pyrophosphatase